MKDTPTEERTEESKQANISNQSDLPTPPDALPPAAPDPTGPLAKPVATASPPPAQVDQKRRSSPTPFKKKTLLLGLVMLALVAGLASAAYAALNSSKHQQPGMQLGVTPTATLVPTESPAQREAQFINQMISQMSLEQELGQMVMIEWDEGGTFNADLQYMLDNQYAGGIILYDFNNNIQTLPQTAALTAAIQAHASIPLLVSIDQEGGNVNRLGPVTGPRPSARDIGASGNPNTAYKQGVSDAQILKQLGINDNLAPDVDVQTVSDSVFNASTMVGFEYRMYGTTAEKVADYAGAYLNGLQDQGVIGTLKHWPGLGADTVDPHDTLPVLDRSQADLNKIDFAPYKTLLAQGNVDMIMSTHELVPAYDKTYPATLSPVLIDQVLRHDLGFQGVVITDGLYMGAIRQRWTLAQAAVLAVIAGNDMLLGPYNIKGMQDVLNALKAAVDSGQISKERIDLSVQRILALKIKYGMIKMPQK